MKVKQYTIKVDTMGKHQGRYRARFWSAIVTGLEQGCKGLCIYRQELYLLSLYHKRGYMKVLVYPASTDDIYNYI